MELWIAVATCTFNVNQVVYVNLFLIIYSLLFFLSPQNGLEDYCFLPFTGFLLIFSILTFAFVPETKGKTIEEVTSIWTKEKSYRNGSASSRDSPKEDSFLMAWFDLLETSSLSKTNCHLLGRSLMIGRS